MAETIGQPPKEIKYSAKTLAKNALEQLPQEEEPGQLNMDRRTFMAAVLFGSGFIRDRFKNLAQSLFINETAVLGEKEGYKPYNDPDGFYTISYPKDWNFREQRGKVMEGQNTANPYSYDLEILSLYSDKRVGVTVQAYEHPPKETKPSNARINETPAVYDPDQNLWTIYGENQTFVIQGSYPGLTNFHSRTKVETTEEEMAKNKKLVESVVSTLKFKNAKIQKY